MLEEHISKKQNIDCGEDLGELKTLEDKAVCWWEMPGNLVNDEVLDESKYNLTNHVH